MSLPTLRVNNIDFSNMIIMKGYDYFEEDVHAPESGRNPLDGLMEFTIIASKIYLQITFRQNLKPSRVAQFYSVVSGNGRVNTYNVYSTTQNRMVTFTGYINRRAVGLIRRAANNLEDDLLDSFTIDIVEV